MRNPDRNACPPGGKEHYPDVIGRVCMHTVGFSGRLEAKEEFMQLSEMPPYTRSARGFNFNNLGTERTYFLFIKLTFRSIKTHKYKLVLRAGDGAENIHHPALGATGIE